MKRTSIHLSNEDINRSKRNRFSIDDILEEKKKLIDKEEEEEEDDDDEDDVDEDTTSIQPIIPLSTSSINIDCRLEGKELWAKFYDLGTEMIITKSGRRMFPTVKISLTTTDTLSLFYVFLDVIPVDQKRYRYIYNKSSWLTAGKAEPSPPSRLYMHPDSPFTYDQLQKQVISFEKAKLTNNDVDKTNHLILNSMHKYQPRVHIIRRDKNDPIDDPLMVSLNNESYRTFVFSETQFMAVTAYQNQLITKLKIEKNPFAKGFRDPGGRDSDYESDIRMDSSRSILPPTIYNPQAFLHAQAILAQYWLGKPQPSLLSRLILSSPLSIPSTSESSLIPSSSSSPSPSKTPS